MARLVGLFGKVTGKKGDNVFSVVKGQQIFRQWNPVVANPNTSKQVQVRARMKLMSQLGAVYAPIIAMRRAKGVSPRNKFVSINYPLSYFENNMADIFLKGIQLTQSPNAFPSFQADRTKPDAISCFISEANTNDYDAVVYAAIIVGQDGKLRYWDSVMVTEAGPSRIFQGDLAYTLESIVIYAYGVNYGGAAAAATFNNIEGDAALHIAELFANRNASVTTAIMTATNGLTMQQNVLTGSSDDVERRVLSISVVGNGTTTGQGAYPVGTTVTAVATPASGASFQGWYENGQLVSSSASYQVTLTSNVSLEARFSGSTQNYSLLLTSEPAQGGNVSGAGSYAAGTTVTASATANTGYSFVGWFNGSTLVSSNANYSFQLNANTTLTAKFEETTQGYTVAVSANPAAGGSVSGGGSFSAGQSCTVQATANSGYTFLGWYEGGNQVSSQAGYTFTVNANHTLEARFQQSGGENVTIAERTGYQGTKVNGNALPQTVPANVQVVLSGATLESGSTRTWYMNTQSGSTTSGWTQIGTGETINFTPTVNVWVYYNDQEDV